MKHRKIRLTSLQKALLGKGVVANLRPFTPRQADSYKDAILDGRSHEQALAHARRA